MARANAIDHALSWAGADAVSARAIFGVAAAHLTLGQINPEDENEATFVGAVVGHEPFGGG